MILILRRFRGGPVEGFMGGGQSRDIFRGGPVKKITLYIEQLFLRGENLFYGLNFVKHF